MERPSPLGAAKQSRCVLLKQCCSSTSLSFLGAGRPSSRLQDVELAFEWRLLGVMRLQMGSLSS